MAEADDGHFVALSYFGFVLTRADGNRVALVPLPFVDEAQSVIFRARDLSPPESADPRAIGLVAEGLPETWRVIKGSLEQCLSLDFENHFVGSEQSGKTFFAQKQNLFENYFILSIQNLRILKNVILKYFHDPYDHQRHGFPLGLKNFNLVWNNLDFPLQENNPLSARFQGDQLRLRRNGAEVRLATAHGLSQAAEIWIEPIGNIGNRALQYLTAAGVREFAPEAKIANLKLQMWGVDQPAPKPPEHLSARIGLDQFHIDVPGFGACLRQGRLRALIIDSYTFHVDHYPPREKCKKLFPVPPGTGHVVGYDERFLVCNVRGGEVLEGVHPDYIPMPAGYYRFLQRETGLRLVFYGQLGGDTYSAHLREEFPEAHFVPSGGEAVDFETLRKSKNIAVAISTFSWLAAFLSEAKNVFIPVCGMFNPIQHPGQNYLPIGDETFKFVLTPAVKAASLFTAPERFWQIQERVAKSLSFMSPNELAEIMGRASLLPRDRKILVGGFDPDFYCRHFPEAAIQAMRLENAPLGHYLRAAREPGFLPATPFDEAFYASTYPQAEKDVALGRYRSLYHHYVAFGWLNGFRPGR